MSDDVRRNEVKRQLEQSRRLQSGALDKTTSERIGKWISDLETEQNELVEKAVGPPL